ncbi:UNVERIFIED_CONTAM: hypothetical protein Slati_0881100 [Sesamum latifolium]|uniref:Reverse transcriptase zinc-binding domain-containing protein n=1 Tax=Sesamum latifolium TaxID=2727402 RepID=A0AAW2XMP5_9LAMI
MNLSVLDRLYEVIHEGHWQWPVTTDINCLTILHSLPVIHGDTDKIIWSLDGGHFSTAGAYTIFSPRGPKVGWSSLLLGRFKTSRHNFILWLAFLGRLSTMDKPWIQHGMGTCVLSGRNQLESHSHLFFKCFFARECLRVIRRRTRFQWPNREWSMDIQWASAKWRATHVVNMAYRALLAALVYRLWEEQNHRIFQQASRSSSTLGSLVVEDVRQRIISVDLTPSVSTFALYRQWRIPWPVEG